MINKKTMNLIAIIVMISGALGMLFCFPFLWSNNMLDLVGAGFPFVGGAILLGSGLIALGISNKKIKS